MKHGNLAFFIPHGGCPHQCSFCNQNAVTGQAVPPSPGQIDSEIRQALLHAKGRWLEIAYFGGSFTAVDPGYQEELLAVAYRYVESGQVQGIRVSTRPDAIDETVLMRLKRYRVTAVELGAQSMCDGVLRRNRRGHTAAQVEKASAAVQQMGFSLGLQMMTGLDGDTPEGTFQTAQALAALRPDTMRIYPTVVLRGTPLGQRFLCGEYEPMGLSEAVVLCARLLDFFEHEHIPVIRLGLHSSPQLHRDYLAGPWHPAFRELCDSRRFLSCVLAVLQTHAMPAGRYWIQVPPKWLSRAAGHKRENVSALAELGYQIRLLQTKENNSLFSFLGPDGAMMQIGALD